MKYALVMNEKIQHVQDSRPKNFTSRWKKVVEDSTTGKPWQEVKYKYSLNEQGEPIESKIFTNMGLDTFKDKKYAQLSSEGQQYILDKYPMTIQLSAREGWYGEPKSSEIISWVKQHFDIIMQIKQDLYAKTSYQDVDDVYFRKVETDENTMEVISETFWGE